ncbi:MAG: NAD(P)-dependent oxidoreductase [Rhodoferax sp.]|nr:NAD(P)-dependent oxidoreductase [Rhodoferax sp.]
MMKVLVTGGSGFIGQYCLSQLHAKGHEVHAVSSVSRPSTSAVQWHHASLLDITQTRALIRTIKPSHLLHLAWYTKHGKYWTSPENLNWVQGSLALIQQFTESGGERLVSAGTCAEYDWGHGVCLEGQTPLVPATLYGTYKHALELMLRSWCQQTGLSSAWGRVFSLYGPGEHPQRLVASVITALLRGEVATCGNASLIRDYSHAEDVASAFVTLLDSRLKGAVNIGSGDAVTLRDIVEKIAGKLDGRELIQFRAPLSSPNSEPELLLPDIKRLVSTGWKKKFDLDRGLDDTIDWWKSQTLSPRV